MEIIRNGIEDLMIKTRYEYKHEYTDEQVNAFFNYWMLFDEKEVEIIKLLNLPLDILLYSKWYWSERYAVAYEETYGKKVPADWGQYQFKSTLESLEHRLENPDWYGLDSIHNEIHNSKCNCIDCKKSKNK